MTSTSQVIPFQFESREVRTLLIDDQPWFAAKDIICSLGYAKSSSPAKLTEHVPEQWKGVNPIHTPGGIQKLLMLSEQGLYFFLGRSDKPKALPIQMWVAGEVLPAIRKHGRYEDTSGKMDTLLGQTIGTDGFHMLGAIIKGKVVSLPQAVQRRATAKIWSQTHAAFGVRSAADIPADQLDAARNFIAAYALEGEWLPKLEAPAPAPAQQLDIHYPVDYLSGRRPGMQHPCDQNSDFLDVSLLDLIEQFESPCEAILCKLSRAGYNVDGAWWELRTYRNKLFRLRSLIANLQHGFESPHQYVIRKA